MAVAMATTLRFPPNYEHSFTTAPPSSKPIRSSPTKFMIKIKNQIQNSQLQRSSKKNRRSENVDGEFFVDHTCIDCDTCRWMAPGVFTRVDVMSAVSKQPSGQDERLKVLQALLSCPTSSIHTEKPAHDILEVQKTFPIPVDTERLGVYHCGYHSVETYGGASYLIVHPEGNILIDRQSPNTRYTEMLACNIEKLGGARYMFLTHKDDVADHEKWSERLSAERILHSLDVEVSTSNVEMKLNGSGPWSLNDDFQLIHTPGHTKVRMVCLLYKPLKVLFTGDHQANGEESGLTINEMVNFTTVPKQLDSVAMLLDLEFKWIIPAHGRKAVYNDVEEKTSSLKALLTAKQHTSHFTKEPLT